MKQLEESEEARLMADGKLDEVVAKRFERKEKDFLKQIESLQSEVEEWKSHTSKWNNGYNNLKVETEVNSAADSLGLFGHAKPDALAAARSVFSIDQDGNIVALDADGNVQMGKSGKDPLQPQEWLEGMKEKRPHWWPAPQGGGAISTERQDSGVTGFTQKQIEEMSMDEYRRLRSEGKIQ
jgi:hypothetical protein